MQSFNGREGRERVLDNTERTNDLGGGKWSLSICQPSIFTFLQSQYEYLIWAENGGW